MKKGLSFLIVLCLIFTMIGCSSSNPGSADSNAANNQAANKGNEGAAESNEPVTIKFYTYKTKRDEEPYVIAVNAFNEAHPNIQVEYVDLVQNNDTVEFLNKLDVLMAGGEAVDVFHTGNFEQLIERAARGVVAPLDEFYANENVNPQEEYVLNPTYDGKTYGIIANSSQWMVVFNKDHLEEAGLPIPEMGWTWDDYREYAKKLTTPEHYGTYFHTWGEYPNIIAYTELPHPQLKEDLTLNFDDPSFKYFFELRRAMEEEDKSVEPYADVLASDYHVLQQFFAGKASMLATASFVVNAGTLLDRFPHDFQMVYAPVPRSSEDAEMGLTNVSGSFLGVGAKSKHKEAAYTFARWLTTEGAQYLQDIPGWKKVDGNALLEQFYGDKQDLIDLNSLSSTLFDPRVKMNSAGIAVPYGSELKTIVENGFSQYMLNNITFEEAQKFMMTEGQRLIKK